MANEPFIDFIQLISKTERRITVAVKNNKKGGVNYNSHQSIKGSAFIHPKIHYFLLNGFRECEKKKEIAKERPQKCFKAPLKLNHWQWIIQNLLRNLWVNNHFLYFFTLGLPFPKCLGFIPQYRQSIASFAVFCNGDGIGDGKNVHLIICYIHYYSHGCKNRKGIVVMNDGS